VGDIGELSEVDFGPFWLRLPGPGPQPQDGIFWPKFLLETKLEPESSEPLIGFLAFLVHKLWSKTGLGNLQPAGLMQPAWTFDMVRIRIFVTHLRVQDRVKKSSTISRYLDSKPEASIP